MTSSTSAGSTPTRAMRSPRTLAARSSGRTGDSFPFFLPTAVRAAPTMTASLIDDLPPRVYFDCTRRHVTCITGSPAIWARSDVEEAEMQDAQMYLERQRDDIVARLRDFQAGARDTGTGLEGDDAVRDLGGHVEHHTRLEMGFMTRQRLRARLQRVQAALERIARGVYGVCIECGELIAPKRLRAIPEAETCVACQERIERRAHPAGPTAPPPPRPPWPAPPHPPRRGGRVVFCP